MPAVNELTRREADVVKLIARGQRPAEIAINLGIKVSTVRAHTLSARDRTGSLTNAHLAAKWTRWNTLRLIEAELESQHEAKERAT